MDEITYLELCEDCENAKAELRERVRLWRKFGLIDNV